MEARVAGNGIIANVSETSEYEQILDSLNFSVVQNNPNGGCAQNGTIGTWPNYSPPSSSSASPPMPAAEAWAHFYASENHRLRGENEMLKFELQKCYVYISKQETQLKEVKQFEQVQKTCLEFEKKQARDGQNNVKYLEKQLLERQVDLQTITFRANQQQAELQKLSTLLGEASRKNTTQEKQIKELENIMTEQQDALEQLSLVKQVSEGKLAGIREFAREINDEFVHSLEILKRDHSLHFNGNGDISSYEHGYCDDDDEVELKNLERNLKSLSALVSNTFEEVRQIKLNGNFTTSASMGISKVYLKKQAGGDNGATENWSIVPNQHDAPTDKSGDGVSSENNDTTTELQVSSSSSFSLNYQMNNDHDMDVNHHNAHLHRAVCCDDNCGAHCCSCGYQSGDKHALRKHLRYFNLPLLFPCTLCKRRFVGMSYLKTHYHQRHKIPYDSSKDCDACGATFPTLIDLCQHYHSVHQRANEIIISNPEHDGYAKEDLSGDLAQCIEVSYYSGDLPPAQVECCSETFESQETLMDTTTEGVNEGNQAE